jgi:ankyrin repeat protein
LETVKSLLEFGANMHAQTAGGITPLRLAESQGHKAVVRFLRKYAENKRKRRLSWLGWCWVVFVGVGAVLANLRVFPLAVVSFLWRKAINKRRPKSTIAPVVNPAALARRWLPPQWPRC